MTEENEENKKRILNDFAGRYDIYSEFSILIRDLLRTFLISHNYKFQIVHRTKTPEKLEEKIDRKLEFGKKYSNLDDIEDLSGVRIIFYLENDKKRFLRQFYEEFAGCVAKPIEEKFNPKGYCGTHIIFELDKARHKLTEYSKYKNIKCELQVTSIFYHAWTEIEHDIVYKPSGDTKLLTELGLDDIHKAFEKVMAEHLQIVTANMDYLVSKYQSIVTAGKLFKQDFIKDLSKCKSNDEIFGVMEIAGKFCHKKPEVLLDLIRYILNKKPLKVRLIHSSGLYKLHGKSHDDLILKCLDLLNEIKYFQVEKTLQILFDLKDSDNSEIKKKIDELLKNTTKYEYQILKRFGYAAQKVILNFVDTNPKKISLPIIKIVFSELLKPSYEGSEMKDENTFSWLSGPLMVGDELKDIRSRSIQLLIGLFKKTKDINGRISILQILDDALRFPNSGSYEDNFEDMITENAERLIAEYLTLVFDKKDNLIAELPIIQEIESQLNWILRRPIKNATDSAKRFIEKLDRSEIYRISRLLATSVRDYKGDKDWQEVEKERSDEIDIFFGSLCEDNIKKYTIIFEQIGKDLDRSNAWEWRGFSHLLYRIAKEKPELANTILDGSKLLREKFLVEFADGFRKGNWWDSVDRIAKLAVGGGLDLIQQFFESLGHINKTELKEKMRKSDLNLMERAIKNTNEFKKFEIAGSGNVIFHNALIWALVAVYKYNPQKIESLIMEEFKLNQDFVPRFLDVINVGIIREQIRLNTWSKNNLKTIIKYLVEMRDLDHDSQNILKEIARIELEEAFSVFGKRIKKEKSELPKKSKLPYSQQYDSIPNYFDGRLVELLREDHRTFGLLYPLVINITGKNYPYDWRVTELCQKIGGKPYQQILDKLIASKTDGELEIAAQLIGGVNPPDIDLCMRIIQNSSGPGAKRLWSTIRSRLFTTGIVTGEYGMKHHYEGVKKHLEETRKKTKNKNIKQFTNSIIENLEKQIGLEDKRVKEELLLRKIEFEG